MRESSTFTVSLPPAMAKEIERAMKAEHRTRSELVREALRVYLSAPLIPAELPTPAEARAYRRGMAAYRRGDSMTLQEYLDGMDRRSSPVPQEGLLNGFRRATRRASWQPWPRWSKIHFKVTSVNCRVYLAFAVVWATGASCSKLCLNEGISRLLQSRGEPRPHIRRAGTLRLRSHFASRSVRSARVTIRARQGLDRRCLLHRT
jgi:Arc/MetJ-type ribon-helix-helix transcriptional regulator